VGVDPLESPSFTHAKFNYPMRPRRPGAEIPKPSAVSYSAQEGQLWRAAEQNDPFAGTSYCFRIVHDTEMHSRESCSFITICAVIIASLSRVTKPSHVKSKSFRVH